MDHKLCCSNNDFVARLVFRHLPANRKLVVWEPKRPQNDENRYRNCKHNRCSVMGGVYNFYDMWSVGRPKDNSS